MQKYDLIIIGGGVSGLSGAMYATRLGLKTLCFAQMPGGLITSTHLVENWPGIKSISGPDLAMSIYEHAQATGAEIRNEKVEKIERADECFFKVKTAQAEYDCKSVLIATGTIHRKLNIPGEKEFENKGVSFCALCDGAFYKNKKVAVVGGGDAAAKEALFLSEHASEVHIFVRRDAISAEPVNAKNVEANPKIHVHYKSELREIVGGDRVERIKLKSGEEMAMDGIFPAIGHVAQTDLARELGVELNAKGEIMINRHSETNLKGVFSSGDCTDTEFKQAITGSAEAVTAAYYAYRHCTESACFL